MASTTFSGPVTSTNGFIGNLVGNIVGSIAGTVTTTHAETVAINATGTATAAQVATGYITSTSAAITNITLPTGTLLGAALGAAKGTVFDFFVDNTGGVASVNLVPSTNAIVSGAAVTTAGSFGDFTFAPGATGLGRVTVMFSSPTAYVYTRTA